MTGTGSNTMPPVKNTAVSPPRTVGRMQPTLIRWLKLLSFRRMSALYIFVALFMIFAIWTPDTFLTSGVWASMLDGQALNALVAVALVVPLAAGRFDLAIGSEVGFASVLVAALLANRGYPIAVSIPMTLLTGALVGLATGVLIVRMHIDSFIASLGVSSVLVALTECVSGSQQILNLGSRFQNLATTRLLGSTTTFWLMIIVAAVVWYVLECTPVGRHVYATGGNRESARLAGVNTSMVIVVSLVACGVIAALAGVLESSRIATGDPTVGPGFMLPGFAAAFLGSTQFKSGRYNVWGAVVSVYVLAVGVKGLQLAGAPVWIPDLFNGVALLLAVGMASRQGAARVRRRLLRGRASQAAVEA